MFYINVSQYFVAECHLISVQDIPIWDTLLIKLAQILDDARWTINNFSPVKAELCEMIIMTIQPLLHYAGFIGMNNLITQELFK